MNLLPVFHALPYPLRQATASLRGWQLRRWRYGPETEELVAAALERDYWPADRWRSWLDERLAQVLNRAATTVPYYCRRGERTDADSVSDISDLGAWKPLDKEEVRQNPDAFLAGDLSSERLYAEQTSGSTGTPVRLWWSAAAVREWYALVEARSRRWYGVSRHDRWAILGGRLVAPAHQQRPPFWVWNAGLHQLYLSSFHLAPDHVSAYLKALRDHRVRYLWGYTSALHALARCAGSRARELGMKVVITNAEPVSDVQRRDIERAFGCSVRETYGLAELVAAAGECESGSLHLWPEVGFVEETETGECLATGLLNDAMPLIRYRFGDRLRLTSRACPCVRSLPVVAEIDGRDDDAVVTPDGRRVGRLDVVFKADLPVIESQVIQETKNRVRVLVVPAREWSSLHRDLLLDRLRAHLGEFEFSIEETEGIPRIRGKFRSVISKLRLEDRS